MSDNFIVFVPVGPRFVPAELEMRRAQEMAARLFPTAGRIELERYDEVSFFDAGGNFDTIHCSSCGKELAPQWWTQLMDRDYQNSGFALDRYRVPCCGALLTLNELRYNRPQAFGRFGLSIMNPYVSHPNSEAIDKTETALSELERVLSTKLQVIYRHL